MSSPDEVQFKRSRRELEERRNRKAEAELKQAADLRSKNVSGTMISTRAASLLLGCSTKTLEVSRRDQSGWGHECAKHPKEERSGAPNRKVVYSLDCLTGRTASRPLGDFAGVNPIGRSLDMRISSFSTWADAVHADEAWVIDRQGSIIDLAVVVSDEDLDAAMDDDRLIDCTLSDALIDNDWVTLSVRDIYERLFRVALDDVKERTRARRGAHVLRDSFPEVVGRGRRSPRLDDKERNPD